MAAQSPRTVVLTGATSGIGLETAQHLAAQVDHLVVQGPEPADAVRDQRTAIAQSGGAAVTYVAADFSSLADVARAAAAIREATGGAIDALINDAGVPGAQRRVVTGDGHERTLQINYLALVLLSELLLPSIAPSGRIVNLASATHQSASLDLGDIELARDYSPVRAYARSKLAIVMYTLWRARVHPDGPTFVSLQPGVINTGLLDAMFGRIGTSVDVGASSVLAALSAPARGGEYFDEGRIARASAEARDVALGDALMAWTFTALSPHLR
ncbi:MULTISPECIES: SDR family NAD(P)-dependent oxidoreductase [Microbacterium]|uniref:SDR family NAD(P)-dependent oxidoreductase n=1 Tax=Microbacterium TaxID=33882 RepID=UPI000D641A43|nr:MULTISPECIES: SDR family NAD(P)-dependent oxidoreductase [Microbacterium]